MGGSEPSGHDALYDCSGGQGRGGLFVIFVLSSMLQDAGELCVVEVALLVNGCFPEELVHLLVRETVSHGCQQFSQVVLVDDTWSRG